MLTLSYTGFSYSFVPVMMSVITYSDYIARGFNLEDDFNPSMIPASAGDGMFYMYTVYWKIWQFSSRCL